jgi:hypothetical protein
VNELGWFASSNDGGWLAHVFPGCCLIPSFADRATGVWGSVLTGDYPDYSVLRHKPTRPSRAELELKAGGLSFVAAVWTDGRSSGPRRPMLEVYLGPSTAPRSLAPPTILGKPNFLETERLGARVTRYVP